MEYFVSFSHITKDSSFGYGNINIDLKKPITEMETIKEMQDFIMKRKPELENVVIINYIPLHK